MRNGAGPAHNWAGARGVSLSNPLGGAHGSHHRRTRCHRRSIQPGAGATTPRTRATGRRAPPPHQQPPHPRHLRRDPRRSARLPAGRQLGPEARPHRSVRADVLLSPPSRPRPGGPHVQLAGRSRDELPPRLRLLPRQPRQPHRAPRPGPPHPRGRHRHHRHQARPRRREHGDLPPPHLPRPGRAHGSSRRHVRHQQLGRLPHQQHHVARRPLPAPPRPPRHRAPPRPQEHLATGRSHRRHDDRQLLRRVHGHAVRRLLSARAVRRHRHLRQPQRPRRHRDQGRHRGRRRSGHGRDPHRPVRQKPREPVRQPRHRRRQERSAPLGRAHRQPLRRHHARPAHRRHAPRRRHGHARPRHRVLRDRRHQAPRTSKLRRPRRVPRGLLPGPHPLPALARLRRPQQLPAPLRLRPLLPHRPARLPRRSRRESAHRGCCRRRRRGSDRGLGRGPTTRSHDRTPSHLDDRPHRRGHPRCRHPPPRAGRRPGRDPGRRCRRRGDDRLQHTRTHRSGALGTARPGLGRPAPSLEPEPERVLPSRRARLAYGERLAQVRQLRHDALLLQQRRPGAPGLPYARVLRRQSLRTVRLPGLDTDHRRLAGVPVRPQRPRAPETRLQARPARRTTATFALSGADVRVREHQRAPRRLLLRPGHTPHARPQEPAHPPGEPRRRRAPLPRRLQAAPQGDRREGQGPAGLRGPHPRPERGDREPPLDLRGQRRQPAGRVARGQAERQRPPRRRGSSDHLSHAVRHRPARSRQTRERDVHDRDLHPRQDARCPATDRPGSRRRQVPEAGGRAQQENGEERALDRRQPEPRGRRRQGRQVLPVRSAHSRLASQG